MTRPLAIGDRVRVVGPDRQGHSSLTGFVFTVEQESDIDDAFSCPGLPWFPESSLELVEDARSTFEYPTTSAKDFEELSLRDVARMSGICKNENGVWISTHLSRLAAIQKRQGAQQNRMDDLLEDYREFKDLVFQIHDRVNALETGKADKARVCPNANPEPDVVSKILDEPELKVGDWVVGPWAGAKIFRIASINLAYVYDENGTPYTPGLMRRLTAEEIARRLNA